MKVLLWFSIAVAAAVYICNPIQDPDLWWHISSGRWILSHYTVPAVDSWNMFGAGRPWRAYSWSNEIVFAITDDLFGERGLLVLKLLLAAVLALSLFYVLGKIAEDWFVGGFLGLFATLAVYNHFTLRPQVLVWIFFVWLIYHAQKIARQGSLGLAGFWLFFLMMLWANSHLSAILGVGVVLAWLWPDSGWRRDRLWQAAFLCCLLGTLVTPYLGGEWLTLFHKSAHPFRFGAISEFQPANIMQYSTGFLLLLGVLLLAFLHQRPQALGVAELLFTAALTLGSLTVLKFLPFAVICISALLAECWRKARDEERTLGNIAEALNRLRAVFHKLPEEGLSFVFLCTVLVNVYKLWHYPVELSVVPVLAVDFIQKHNLPHPILNSFGYGGYLIYRFSDKKGTLQNLVPIDGRTNVIPQEVWAKYLAAFKGKRNWQEYFDVVKPETVLWRADSPLSSILLAGEEWCLVFPAVLSDKGAMVFVKQRYFAEHASTLQSRNCAQPAGRSG